MKSNVKLRFIENDTFCFGPGVYSLLSFIESEGSVRAASEEMGLSYSKAWRMIKDAESGFGFSLVERRSGGKDGGKAKLSDKGREILSSFSVLEKDVKEYAEEKFNKIFLPLLK